MTKLSFLLLVGSLCVAAFVGCKPKPRIPAERGATVMKGYALPPWPKSMDELQVGSVETTCSFVIDRNNQLWISKKVSRDGCIKIRKDSDGFTAILPISKWETWEQNDPPMSYDVRVKRIEYEP